MSENTEVEPIEEVEVEEEVEESEEAEETETPAPLNIERWDLAAMWAEKPGSGDQDPQPISLSSIR